MVKACAYCGKEFKTQRKKQLYCSCSCGRRASLDSVVRNPKVSKIKKRREVTPAMHSFFFAIANFIIKKGGSI